MKVVIYGQMSKKKDLNIEGMKKYIKKQKWELVEGIFDYEGSCEGLFSLLGKLNRIDIILIYNRNNISDEFILQFLYETAKSENVEVIEFNMDDDT